MKKLFETVYGSRLYGTHDPEKSDTDIKGVFLPSKGDLLLCKAPRHLKEDTNSSSKKNTADDIDCELYSIQNYVDMACRGEMIVIDMLHANEESIRFTTPEWDFVRKNKEKFYTSNMSKYLAYVRKQTAKYSEKGNRIAAVKYVIDVIGKSTPTVAYAGDILQTIKLSEIYDSIEERDHIHKKVNPDNRSEDKRVLIVCGKEFHVTVSLSYLKKNLEQTLGQWGDRAQQAYLSQGVDWKAVSHAFRACYQVKEILETGNLVYPLARAEFIKDVKYGKLHYKDDKIGERLDLLLDKIEKLSDSSEYPKKVDRDFWDNWIVNLY